MDGRKRPAPRSRGNSPPSQRRRQSEQPSTTDRHPDTAYPRALSSPPYSRNNSLAGLPVNARTGPAPRSANERLIDQNSRNSSRDVLHGHDRSQNGAESTSSRKASTEHSPMHVMSPMSNGSGSKTPVQVAPIVPSMLPVAQKPVMRQSAPLDTLSALRSQKSSSALAATQGIDGPTTTELKVLRAQSRAAQLENARLKSQVKQLEDQVKQFEALPAQLAALKGTVEQRESAAAKGLSPEEIEHRLTALEKPKSVIEVAQLAQLQSDVQAMKTDIEILGSLREQLKHLQSTAKQHSTEIVEVIANSTKLRTDVDGLATLRDDIQVDKEQRQAIKGDAVKIMIQTALQPEIKKLDTWRTKNEKTLKEISTTVEANHKFCSDLNKRNVPKELQTLQKWINKVESNNSKTDERTMILEQIVKNMREDDDALYDDVKRCIGPIKQAHITMKETVLERIEYLEDKSKSLRSDQDVLSGEQDKLSDKLDKLFDKLDKIPTAPTDPSLFARVVAGFGEDIKKLTEDVKEMKARTKQLQQQLIQAQSTQEVHTILSDEQKKLSERVRKLEVAPDRLASSEPAIGNGQLRRLAENLENRVSGLDEAFKRVSGQIRSLQDEQSKFDKTQKSLQTDHDALADQIKIFEGQHARLSNEHSTMVDQLMAYRGEQEGLDNQQKVFQAEQTKSSNEQGRCNKALDSLENRVSAAKEIANQVKILAIEQAKFSNEQNKISDRVSKLETTPRSSVAPRQSARDKDVNSLLLIPPEVADIQQKLHTLYDHVYGESGLNTIIDGLQDDVEKMGEEVHAHGTDLDLLQNDFTAIFAKHFDPFRTSVEEQLKAHGQTFIQHFESLSKLEERIITLQSEEETRTFTVSQLQSLNNLVHSMAAAKEHLSRLQNSLDAEVHQRNAAVEDLKKQVALKQDTLVATQAIDTVKAAVRNLQDQYDNISTDDLHQKMVHWFLQAYPSNAANMIQQFGVIQHEIAQLRKFTDQISRIPDGTQTLSALAQIGPQLITLAQSPPGYKDSVEGLAESKEALKSMSETMTKLQTQYVGLAHTVGSLQAFMRSLNSNTAPFARAESLVALQESIRKLQEEERQARNEFATKAGKEHDQRVEAEGKIRRGINDLTTKIDKELKERIEAEQEIVFTNNQWFKEFEKDTTGKIKATSEQLEALQAALDKFRADFNEVLDDTSKEFLNRLPTLYVVTAELQTFLEDLNMNLPKGPLHIEWTADLNADVFATPAPESHESRNAACKGKSKQ